MTTVWIVISVSSATAVVGFVLGLLVAWGSTRRQRNATDATAQSMEATQSSIRDQAESINNRLSEFQRTVADLRSDTADQSGRIDTELQRVASEAGKLNAILSSPNVRGDWGEHHAEDVLRAAGFQEGVNYTKKMKQPGGEEPDFTFHMPNGLRLHMDVKLPTTNYQRVIEASDERPRKKARQAFVRNVDDMVRGIRGYADLEDSIEVVLMLIPNESVYAFVHEADPRAVGKALRHRVVLCSPLTLFSVLAIIRRAIENFQLERRSGEILRCLDAFREEWDTFTKHLDKTSSQFKSFKRSWDELTGVRRDELQDPVDRIRAYGFDKTEPLAPGASQPDAAADALAGSDEGRSQEGAGVPGARPSGRR